MRGYNSDSLTAPQAFGRSPRSLILQKQQTAKFVTTADCDYRQAVGFVTPPGMTLGTNRASCY